MRTMGNQWEAYKAANQAFADVVLEHYQDGDIVWCQDYHVMLLPSILKRAKPNMKVGWFLHTPFPSSEIYRTLPLREEILRGVLVRGWPCLRRTRAPAVRLCSACAASWSCL